MEKYYQYLVRIYPVRINRNGTADKKCRVRSISYEGERF